MYGQFEEWGLGVCAFCLSVKLILCSDITYIYGQLEGVHLPEVYVDSAIS